MAKALYVGVSGIARKVKKVYIGGTDGKAKKVKKMYIGDANGKARLCWAGGGGASYYGTADPLGAARTSLKSATVGNYAVIGSGTYSWNSVQNVDAYNKSLTHTNVSSKMNGGDYGAASIGNYALFCGGSVTTTSGTNIYYSSASAYNTSLTKSSPTSLGYSRTYLNAATVGGYAIYGPGLHDSGTWTGVVDAYNTSLTHTNLSGAYNGSYAAASNGSYVVFAGGGSNYVDDKYVEAWNSSLTKTTPSESLTYGGYGKAGVGFKGYTIFSQGIRLEAYNTSLTHSVLSTTLSKSVKYPAGTIDSTGEYALIGGGSTNEAFSGAVGDVNVLDGSLTRSVADSFSDGAFKLTAVAIGKYVLFAGGQSLASSSGTDTVNVYEIG